MPINHDMMHSQSHDEVAALKARIAEPGKNYFVISWDN